MSREIQGRGDEYRDVAADWHGGQWSPLYAYASTGTIIAGLVAEIDECLASTVEWRELDRLGDLRTYVREHGADS